MYSARAVRVALAIFGTVLVWTPAAIAQPTAAGTYPTSIVTGRNVSVRGSSSRVAGELLSVSADSIWVLERRPWDIRSLPLEGVRTVKVRRGKGAGTALIWSVVGMVATGTALTAACNSVEGADCGDVFPAVVLGWGVVGGLAAIKLGAGRYQELEPRVDRLRPYARYPQGLPAEVRRGGPPARESDGADPG